MSSLGKALEGINGQRMREGKIATFSIRLINGQSYMIQIKDIGEDHISVKVHNSWSRYIAIDAIAEFWDVSESDAHTFKDIEPKGE
jgi:hypothetical protein